MKAYLEPEDITLLENCATNFRDKLLIHLLFHSGCRISEALAIGVNNIDFDSGRVTILHLKTRAKINCPKCKARLGKNHSYCPGCGEKVSLELSSEVEHRRVRSIPLDNSTLDMLKEFIEKSGPIIKGDKLILFDINRHRAWQIVKQCAEKAGLPKLVNPETGRIHNVSPHRLRDAFAVYAVKHNDTGDGLRMLQEHLGHQAFNTTARYRKVAGEELRCWYDDLWENNHDKP